MNEPPSPTVVALDEQDVEPVEVERWAALATAALTASGVGADAELNLLFVDETAMAELNETHLGAAVPTDVLAFPIDDDDVDALAAVDAPRLIGDVVICPAVAARAAPDHAGTYDDELALLVVHGVLHVLGMDHAEPGEQAAMQARERELLDRFHRSPHPVTDRATATDTLAATGTVAAATPERS